MIRSQVANTLEPTCYLLQHIIPTTSTSNMPSDTNTNTFNILTSLPNELLFQTLESVNNEDIETLHSIPSIKSRLESLFFVISDISHTRYFKSIPHTSNLKQFMSSPTFYQKTHGPVLWTIVEINDLQNSALHLPKLSSLIRNRISIYDDYIPVGVETGDSSQTYRTWMQNLDNRLTQMVIFENLQKLELSDMSLDPQIFKFPNLARLKLTRCESLNEMAQFDLPNLQNLSIEGRLKTLNNSIDFHRATFKQLNLTGIRDMDTWTGIENWSIEQICIYQGCQLVKFIGLKLHNLKTFVIKDTDIEEVSYWECPLLEKLHLEQYINSSINIHHLNLPRLTQLLVWVFQLRQFYNVHIPQIDVASIMLHNEPVPAQLGPEAMDRIDFSSFARLRSLQICDAAEILAFCDNLEHLEVRGPFSHDSLFLRHFTTLQSLQIYFNNSLRELPKLIAPNLQKLTISRCTSLKDISNIQIFYPNLQEFHSEYSVLSVIENVQFPTLKRLGIMSSAMNQAIKIINCWFPQLTELAVKNLEPRSMETSVIQLDTAELLASLSIANFNLKELQVCNHSRLVKAVLNASIENLAIVNCDNLQRLDLSKNSNLLSLRTSHFPNLISLVCDQTQGIKNFHLDTPLLERIEYDEIVRYVKRPPPPVNDI